MSAFTAPEARRFTVVARLRAGVGLAEGRTELTGFAERFAAAYPETNRNTRFVVRPLRDVFVGRVRPYLVLLAAAVALALLLAMANVVNLMLARAVGLRSELALRTALGASRGRLLALVATEAVVLAGCGGLAGIALGATLTRLVTLAPLQLPPWLDVRMDWRVMAFAVGLAALVALGVALLPWALMSNVDPREALLEGTRRTAGSPRLQGWQRGLVAVQVAMAVVLLTFRVDPPSRPYSSVEPISLFYRRASERLRALPGVTAVGHNETLPFGGRPDTTRTMTVEGRAAIPGEGDQAFVNHQVVSASYFGAMRIPLQRGRVFVITRGPVVSCPFTSRR